MVERGTEHMSWSTLKGLGKLTVIALMGMALAHVWATIAREGELPVFAVVFESVLIGLAVMAATGRWLWTALAAVLSGVIGLVSTFGASDASPRLEGAEAVAVAVFLSLALVAFVSGLAASLQTRRSRRQTL